ncbi:DNA sulfur modification protein DndD [Sedimentibacter hydroxybenzoicus DSM 7310]|uniref:Nuclease SbcCD subunit C n=1 Tax=Sedimentibacter hydroxybenzoicus DSM 7310 TaxID=1123245 RepID=A0A974GWY3_SEDHY|nr:DNA sulfur modification protein DndD [Sedimentibacter hydroxybenzoicus]NYB74948.1 DNA sulfur modification protein DndD [Sedimentibacter hydroxybenzoicus DSM 7310]
MIIKKLTLCNFGVYAGENMFLFENRKPIVLVGGMNGRGKTTFLEAVLLALYGSNSFAYSESNQKSYAQYLRSFVNRSESDKTCSVELEFEINNEVKENYIVKREWDTVTKITKERISIYKDGIYNEFLTNNWPMFVENILPSALSSFFFFDGEKIAELSVDNTNVQLKNSIRSMLGISVLDVLSNDIMRNLKKTNKKGKDNKNAERVQELREEKEKAIEALATIDAQIEELSHKLVGGRDNLETLHQLYTAKGGDAVDKRQETVKKRATLMADLSGEESRLYELTASELPLLLVKDLIRDIKLQATDEHADMIMKQVTAQLDGLYKEFESEYSGDTKASLDFINYVKAQVNSDQSEPIYELSDQALFQTNNLVESIMKNVDDETRSILVSKKKLEKQIGELDSYLSLDINDKELQEIYNQIKGAEQIIIDYQVKMLELDRQRSAANSKMMTATAEFSKYVESYLSTAELRDSTDRIIKYSNMALNIIEKYIVELQKRKTDVLADTITDCYKKLANKKNLIKKIVMDSETLDIQYLSEDGQEVPKDFLSAGEKQLMVISILWALAICSKKSLPVIIDTPLSRLDSLHRTSLVTNYFPNAGEQTIILSTDSEIDAGYYKLMKANVGDEFTLKYDETTKSTSIKRGYLIGAEI